MSQMIQQTKLQPSVSELTSKQYLNTVPAFPNNTFNNKNHYINVNYELYRANFVHFLANSLYTSIKDQSSCLYNDQQVNNRNKFTNKKTNKKNKVGFFVFKRFIILNEKKTKNSYQIETLVTRLVSPFTQPNQEDKEGLKIQQIAILFNRDNKQILLGRITQIFKDNSRLKNKKEVTSLQKVEVQEKCKIKFDIRNGDILPEKNHSNFSLICPREYWFSIQLCLKALIFQQQFPQVAFQQQTIFGIPESGPPQYNNINWQQYKQQIQNEVRTLPKVNARQRETIRYALQNKSALIQGPPGTGKSFVAFEIRKILIKHYWGKSQKPILIITKKNATLDEQLTKDKSLGHKVIRLGHRYCKKLYDISLDALLDGDEENDDDEEEKEEQNRRTPQSHGNQQLSYFYQPSVRLQKQKEAMPIKRKNKIQKFNYNLADILKDYQVIGLTFSGYHNYIEAISEIQPEIVIIEEASEVIESEMAPVLCPWVKHLIQIGDQQQLRPIVKYSKLSKSKNYGLSYFERLIQVQNAPYMQLEEQRRMRPELSVYSRTFYRRYDDDPSVNQLTSYMEFGRHKSYFLPHTYEESSSEEGDIINYFEAHFIVQTAEALYEKNKKSGLELNFTILTMYRAQFELISFLLQKVEGNISVSSVDGFQGLESDVILISCVRSNVNNDIGFLKMYNRINVALSRAKLGLFILGNFEMFRKQSPDWNKIISLSIKNGSYLNQYTNIPDKIRRREQKVRLAQDLSSTIFKCSVCTQYAHIGGC